MTIIPFRINIPIVVPTSILVLVIVFHLLEISNHKLLLYILGLLGIILAPLLSLISSFLIGGKVSATRIALEWGWGWVGIGIGIGLDWIH